LIKVNVDKEVNLKRGEIERKERRGGGLRGEMRGKEKKREKGRKKGGCEKMMRGREKGGGAAAAECYFRSRVFPIYTCFFLSAGMVEPVRFGSIGFRL
jgi:hypothetical protein